MLKCLPLIPIILAYGTILWQVFTLVNIGRDAIPGVVILTEEEIMPMFLSSHHM